MHTTPLLPPLTPPAAQHGGAVVEFALLLTLMISLAAGIFEFGRAFWYYDALSKATRNAARNLSVTANTNLATTAVPAARDLVVSAALSAGVPNFTSDKVTIECLDSSLNVTACSDGTSPAGVRVQVSNYTVSLGDYIPFLVGASTTYVVTLSPATAMPYML